MTNIEKSIKKISKEISKEIYKFFEERRKLQIQRIELLEKRLNEMPKEMFNNEVIVWSLLTREKQDEKN